MWGSFIAADSVVEAAVEDLFVEGSESLHGG